MGSLDGQLPIAITGIYDDQTLNAGVPCQICSFFPFAGQDAIGAWIVEFDIT
jgi:hypothetical protein